MNRKIFKYPIEIRDKVKVEMPLGSQIISVHRVGEELCLYAIVNPEIKDMTIKVIEIIGTGNPYKSDLSVQRAFLGTVVLKKGAFVAHVFEKIGL